MFILSYKILFYFFMPAILRGVGDWAKDREIGAKPFEIATVYGIESISLITWLVFLILTLYWIGFGDRFNISKGKEKSEPFRSPIAAGSVTPSEKWPLVERVAMVFMVVICLLYLCYFPYTLDAIAALNIGQGSLIQPVVMLSGPIVGLYLFSVGKGGRLIFVLSMVVTVLALFSYITYGSRGQVISVALFLTFIYLFVSRKTYILYIAIVGIVLIVMSHNVMTIVRARDDFKSKSMTENFMVMIAEIGANRDDGDFWGALDFRFGEASRRSVGFLRLVDSGICAGFNPIKSSLYGLIPRRYFPDKPVQGSIDGTKEGMGMYIIHSVMTPGSANMSDFFTGLHAYWELEFLGVFLFSAISGVFIALCVGFFGKFGSAGLPLMMIMLKPPWLEPKLWISEIIGDIFHTLIPLVVLWYAIKVALKVHMFWKKTFIKFFYSCAK